MQSENLANTLSRAELPDSTAAVERTVAAARELVGSAVTPEPRTPLARRVLAFAAVGLLVAGFLAFTPPGRAAADWIEDLIGVGGPARQTLGIGTSPAGDEYEVRAEINEGIDGKGGQQEACLMFDWSDERPEGSPQRFGVCESGLRSRSRIDIPFIAGAGKGMLLVGAHTNIDPSEVRLEYRPAADAPTEDAPVAVFRLDEAAKAAIRAPAGTVDATFMLGFLPDGVGEVGGPTSAELVALDGDETELARVPVEWTAAGGPMEKSGYKTPCRGHGPTQGVCRSVTDPAFRFRQFVQQLTAERPPDTLVSRATAAGVTVSPLKGEDLRSIVESDPELDDPREAMYSGMRALRGEFGPSASGGYALYAALGVDERLVFAIHLTPRRPGERDILVLIDAASGEPISLTRLEP